MPLKTSPDPTDLAGILAAEGLPADTGTGRDAGDTSPAADAAAPAYLVACDNADGQFTAKLVITKKAEQGSNTSVYLAAGIYETNSSLYLKGVQAENPESVGSNLEQFGPRSSNRVYLHMPADLADLNRQAELEHCDDLHYAYQQTLGAFEAALTETARLAVTKTTEAEARDGVLAHLRDALPQARRHLGTDPAAWLEEYQRLCAQTATRDSEGWHNFGLESADAAAIPGSANPTYLTGKSRDDVKVKRIFLRFTKGSTEIGIHSSAQVIV